MKNHKCSFKVVLEDEYKSWSKCECGSEWLDIKDKETIFHCIDLPISREAKYTYSFKKTKLNEKDTSKEKADFGKINVSECEHNRNWKRLDPTS